MKAAVLDGASRRLRSSLARARDWLLGLVADASRGATTLRVVVGGGR